MKNTEINTNEFAALAKELRQSLNMSQVDLAKAMNVTPGYICNIENGRTAMSLPMLIFFAKLTGKSLDALVGRISSEYHENAIDNELMDLIKKLNTNKKEKLIETLKIWIDE